MTQLTVKCGNCDHPNVVDSRLAGSKAICSNCDAMFVIPDAAVAQPVTPPVHTRFKAPVAEKIQPPREEQLMPLAPPIDDDPEFMTDDGSELVWSDVTRFAAHNPLATAVFLVSFVALVVQASRGHFWDGFLWLLLGLTIVVNPLRRAFLRAHVTPESETLVAWGTGIFSGVIALRAIWQIFDPAIENEAVSFAIATMSLVTAVTVVTAIVVIAILLFRHGLFTVSAIGYLVSVVLVPLVVSSIHKQFGDVNNSFLWTNPPWWASTFGSEELEEDIEPVRAPGAADSSKQLFDLAKVPVPNFPELPPKRLLEPGVEIRELSLNVPPSQPGKRSDLHIYTPQGDHPVESLPCVLIAAPGKSYLAGSQLSVDLQADHLLYARAGFAVVAYEVDGPLPSGNILTEAQITASFKEFLQSHAGLINARNALEFAVAKMPEINKNRLYVAGHGTAGTLALLFAEHEPQVRACLAYNPLVNLPYYFQPPPQPKSLPGSKTAPTAEPKKIDPQLVKIAMANREFIRRASPSTHATQLKVPVFLLQSGGDNDSKKPLVDFASQISRFNANVELAEQENASPGTDQSASAEVLGADAVARGLRWLGELPSVQSIASNPTLIHQSLGPVPNRWAVQPDAGKLPTTDLITHVPMIPLAQGSFRDRVIAPVVASPWLAITDSDSGQPAVNLWNLQQPEADQTVKLDSEFALKPILSPDGKFLAGPAQGGRFIRVVSFATGSGVSFPIEAELDSLVVRFIDDTKLVVAGNVMGKADCDIWNYQSGTPVREITFPEDFVFASKNAVAFSPGGRYLAVFHQGLKIFDLTSGQLVGDVALPESAADASIEGLRFASDGAELAGLMRSGGRSRLLCWHMSDGALIEDNVLSPDVPPQDGATPLEFFPGNQAWLLYQRAIVDRRWGKYVWPLYAEAGGATPDVEVVKVLDQNHLLVSSMNYLTAFKLPRDSEGQLALSSTQLTAENVFKNRTSAGIPSPINSSAQSEPTQVTPVVADIFAVPAAETEQVAAAAREHAQQAHVKLIKSEKDVINNAVGWYKLPRRPVIGVRWGIGVVFTGSEATPRPVRSLQDFEQVAGRVGPSLLSSLRQQLSEGKFGRWPDSADARLRDVQWLGTGEQDALLAQADEKRLDAVLLFEHNSRNVRGKIMQALRVHVLGIGDFPSVWRSEQLSLTYVSSATRPVDNLWAELGQAVRDRIENLYTLEELPTLKPEQVQSRAALLLRDTVKRPLPFLLEVRYYQVNELLSDLQVAELYAKAGLTPGQATQLTRGTNAERDVILQSLLK